jgi:predicted amidohydrolase
MCGLRTIAVESGLWISGGGIHFGGAPPDPVTGNPRVYNTHVIINEKGILRCLYRKIHLFDVSIPDKVDLRESKTTAGGTELVTCDSPIGTLGVTICYDLRFPEQYIPLVRKGAQILLVPSAFTVPTGAAHWHTLLRGKKTFFILYNHLL